MKDMFKDTFQLVMPLEQVELYTDVIAFFERIGFDSVFEPLQEFMMVSTTHLDTQSLVGEVQLLLDDALIALMENYGITLNDSANTDFILQLAKAIYELDNYYLPEEMIGVFENPEDPEEAIAEAFSLITGTIKEITLEHVYKVDPSLLDRVLSILRERSQTPLETPPVPSVIINERVKLLNLLFTEVKEENIVKELINANVRILTVDFESIVNQNAETLFDLDIQDRALELILLYVFSSAPLSEFYERIYVIADEFSEGESHSSSLTSRMLNRVKPMILNTNSVIESALE